MNLCFASGVFTGYKCFSLQSYYFVRFCCLAFFDIEEKRVFHHEGESPPLLGAFAAWAQGINDNHSFATAD